MLGKSVKNIIKKQARACFFIFLMLKLNVFYRDMLWPEWNTTEPELCKQFLQSFRPQ